MFWRKKKQKTEAIQHTSNCQRDAFRYDFNDDQYFEIQFKDKTVTVLNISAGGLAFQNINFSTLEISPIEFTLNIPNYNGSCEFQCNLRILTIDEKNVCHCLFEDCSLEQYELIHKYVLEMQKNDLAH